MLGSVAAAYALARLLTVPFGLVSATHKWAEMG